MQKTFCDNCEKEMDPEAERTGSFGRRVLDLDAPELRVQIEIHRPVPGTNNRTTAELCRGCFKLAVESAIEDADAHLWMEPLQAAGTPYTRQAAKAV